MRGLKLADTAFLARASSAIVPPPVAGFVFWVAPESRIWLDSAGTTPAVADGEVRRWEDLSGNDNHPEWATASNMGSKGPQWTSTTLNGRRLLRFGDVIASSPVGAGQENRSGLRTPNNVTLTASGITLFFVGSFRQPSVGSPENFGGFFGYNSVAYVVRQNNAAKQITTFNASSSAIITDPSVIGNDSYQAFAWRFGDAINEQRLWRAGASVVSGADAGTVGAAGRVAIGHREDDGITSHLSGDLAEMIVYPSALSDADVNLVNAYLQAKYGV